MASILFAFFLLHSAFAQSPLTAGGLAAYIAPPAPTGGGGGGSFTLLRHATGNAASTLQASVSIDVTGGKLLIVSVSNYQPAGGGLDANPADGVNTYTGLIAAGAPSDHIATNQLFYVINPSGGTVTITCKHSYTILNAAVFSYSGGTPALDAQATGNGHNSSGGFNSIKPDTGSGIAPAGSRLFITGVASSQSFAATPIDSSFTVTDAVRQGGNGLWGGLAYKTSSSTENPAWAFSTFASAGATMATFQ